MSEHQEQSDLIRWVWQYENIFPELRLLFAYPSGQLRPFQYNKTGKRFSVIGQKLKYEGVKAGIPDLLLPVSQWNYHGLAIEMKFGKNKTTQEQDWWLSQLADHDWLCMVIYHYEIAIWVLATYLHVDLSLKRTIMPYGWEKIVTRDAINKSIRNDYIVGSLSEALLKL